MMNRRIRAMAAGVAATAVSTSLLAAGGATLDVVGLKPGLTEEQAIAQLRKHSGALRIENSLWREMPGLPETTAAVAGVDSDSPHVGLSQGGPFNEFIEVRFGRATPTATAISRRLRLNGSVTMAALEDSLVGKYGKPTSMLGPGWWAWSYRADGKPAAGMECANAVHWDSALQSVDRLARPHCSRSLIVYATPVGNNRQLVQGAHFVLYDHAALIRDAEKVQSTVAGAKAAQQQRDVDAAKGNRPKL